jgi:hypothetical protein
MNVQSSFFYVKMGLGILTTNFTKRAIIEKGIKTFLT